MTISKPLPKKTGRPAFAPTARDRRAVEAMAAAGIGQAEIALVMNVAQPTLRRHFRRELTVGAIRAQVAITNALYREATRRSRPSVRAMELWLRCRCGWREATAPETPRERRPEPLGKKAQAALDAKTAHLDSSWEGLLDPVDPDEKPPLQ
jgi:hypothetical protein